MSRSAVKKDVVRASRRGLSKTRGIQVIDRAVHLLDIIGDQEGAALTPLSAGAGLALSTTKRILHSLASNGLVEQQGTGYRLGPRLHFLASRAPTRRNLLEVAHPVLQDLAQRAREDVGFGVLRGGEPIIVDYVAGPEPLKIVAPTNDRVPLNCGWRRVLLAYQPQAWIDHYLRTTTFQQFTKGTITNKVTIRRSLEDIRKRRVAVSYGEYLRDAVGVAAPVFDAGETLAGTLFLIAPLPRASKARVQEFKTLVFAAATTLSDRLRGKRGG